MRTLTVTAKGEHRATESTFTGTKKRVLDFLRSEAREIRRGSRISNGLKDDVHSIDRSEHQSELVTMACFKLQDMRMEQILELINNHGVIKYTVK